MGKAIQIKGDTTYKADGTVEKAGNIKTSIDNGAIKVELNKDVDLTKEGSIKAGETTINKGGVDTNKITIKDSTISISKDGINGGGSRLPMLPAVLLKSLRVQMVRSAISMITKPMLPISEM